MGARKVKLYSYRWERGKSYNRRSILVLSTRDEAVKARVVESMTESEVAKAEASKSASEEASSSFHSLFPIIEIFNETAL